MLEILPPSPIVDSPALETTPPSILDSISAESIPPSSSIADPPFVEVGPPAPPPLEDPTDPSVAARLAVDALFARQSTTLAQASARYTLRTKLPPPPNYDLWFRFAQDRKCLIDEYEMIHRDFKPFYQLAETHPAYFQEMIELAAKQVCIFLFYYLFGAFGLAHELILIGL